MHWTLRRITELRWQNLSGAGRKAHTKTKAFRKAYRSSERPEVESMFNGQQKSHQKGRKAVRKASIGIKEQEDGMDKPGFELIALCG